MSVIEILFYLFLTVFIVAVAYWLHQQWQSRQLQNWRKLPETEAWYFQRLRHEREENRRMGIY